jgi:hypothetical protein
MTYNTRFAYDNALHGGSPLFICNKNKIEAQCPLLTRIFPDEEDSYKYSSWSPDVLSKINMKYINDKNELVSFDILYLNNYDYCITVVISVIIISTSIININICTAYLSLLL